MAQREGHYVDKFVWKKPMRIYVDTCEIKACQMVGTLYAGAIGSCVVVAAYDAETTTAGMAHVMLPGPSIAFPKRSNEGLKCADEMLDELLRRMGALGAVDERLQVWLVGGANVLDDGRQGPGPETVESLLGGLAGYDIKPVALEVFGRQRRSCALEAESGQVFYTVGDSRALPLRSTWAGICSGEAGQNLTTGEPLT